MRRLAGILVAAVIVALFGVPVLADAAPAVSVVISCTYDGHHHPTAQICTTTERGPPASYDFVTTNDPDGLRPLGVSARLSATSTRTITTYDHPVLHVQIARTSGTARGQARVADGVLSSLAGTRSAAKTGPGAWGSATESMSGRAAAYRARVTGGAAGSVYRVGGVKFDGFANGLLQEAKGPGYAKFVRNGQFQPWFSGADDLASQAQRQLAAA